MKKKKTKKKKTTTFNSADIILLWEKDIIFAYKCPHFPKTKC